MNVPTFEEILRDAHRLLGEAEEVLRSPWRGEGPTESQIDTLDDVRDQIAVTKLALDRMVRTRASESEVHDACPASHVREVAALDVQNVRPKPLTRSQPKVRRSRSS